MRNLFTVPQRARIISASCEVHVLSEDGVTNGGPGPLDIEVTEDDVILVTARTPGAHTVHYTTD